MTELEKILATLSEKVAENKDGSKVNGRRNWVIKTRMMNGRRVVVFHGSFGEAERKGLLEETLKRMAEYKIKWEYFTKKADFEKRLSEMEAF